MSAPNLDQQLRKAGPFSASPRPGARAEWTAARRAAGFKGYGTLISPPSSNAKMSKSTTPTYGLSLLPASASGVNVCTWSTSNCRNVCVLMTAGKGVLPSVRKARAVKTQFLADHPADFVAVLAQEIRSAVERHGRIVVRLNVASDLRWEHIAPELFSIPGATFYDYTKAPVGQREPGDNYRLTYSVSERPKSETNAVDALAALANAAVVFDTRKGQPLPTTWRGYRVLDGDVSDDRTQDAPGTVVGLRAKGSARSTDAGGFVKEGVAS